MLTQAVSDRLRLEGKVLGTFPSRKVQNLTVSKPSTVAYKWSDKESIKVIRQLEERNVGDPDPEYNKLPVQG